MCRAPVTPSPLVGLGRAPLPTGLSNPPPPGDDDRLAAQPHIHEKDLRPRGRPRRRPRSRSRLRSGLPGNRCRSDLGQSHQGRSDSRQLGSCLLPSAWVLPVRLDVCRGRARSPASQSRGLFPDSYGKLLGERRALGKARIGRVPRSEQRVRFERVDGVATEQPRWPRVLVRFSRVGHTPDFERPDPDDQGRHRFPVRGESGGPVAPARGLLPGTGRSPRRCLLHPPGHDRP